MSYVTQSRDTTPEVERLQFELWRGMDAATKLRLMGQLCDSVRALALAGLRQRHAHASEHELRMRLYSTWLDRQTMIDCYGWDPGEP